MNEKQKSQMKEMWEMNCRVSEEMSAFMGGLRSGDDWPDTIEGLCEMIAEDFRIPIEQARARVWNMELGEKYRDIFYAITLLQGIPDSQRNSIERFIFGLVKISHDAARLHLHVTGLLPVKK